MKKLSLFLILTFCFSNVFAQEIEGSQRKNDVMLSPIELIAFPALNASYERLLNKNSGIGVNALVSFQNNEDYNTFYQISPFYRMYFGKKYASGFFVEAFLPITTSETEYYNFDFIGSSYYESFYSEKSTTIGFGIGAGAKWAVRNNILFEFSAGLGRRFDAKDSGEDITGKGMLGIGYRF